MITPPRIFSSQAAVASGSGLRKWTWSQVTIGIVALPLVFYAPLARQISRRALRLDFSGRIPALPPPPCLIRSELLLRSILFGSYATISDFLD
jgi:hypothetical protein